jgi:hypothetical protein
LDDKQTAYEEIRKTIFERLKRLQIATELLEDLSVFQLIGLLHLMAGHVGYLPTYVNICWTTETILGKDLFYDSPTEQAASARKKLDVPKEAIN